MQNVKLQFEKKNNDYRIREAFKTLRSNIEFCGGDVKVIAVTSCTPNEGKSSVAMEMARAFAEAGSKTMLIDADMRKSVLVGRYKTGAVRKGLTHCLIGKANYLEVMCETNVPNLYVTFSGPVNNLRCLEIKYRLCFILSCRKDDADNSQCYIQHYKNNSDHFALFHTLSS